MSFRRSDRFPGQELSGAISSTGSVCQESSGDRGDILWCQLFIRDGQSCWTRYSARATPPCRRLSVATRTRPHDAGQGDDRRPTSPACVVPPGFLAWPTSPAVASSPPRSSCRMRIRTAQNCEHVTEVVVQRDHGCCHPALRLADAQGAMRMSAGGGPRAARSQCPASRGSAGEVLPRTVRACLRRGG